MSSVGDPLRCSLPDTGDLHAVGQRRVISPNERPPSGSRSSVISAMWNCAGFGGNFWLHAAGPGNRSTRSGRSRRTDRSPNSRSTESLLPITSSAACRVAVLVIEPAKIPSVWPILISKTCPNPSATSKADRDRHQGQQVVSAAGRSGQALEELPPYRMPMP